MSKPWWGLSATECSVCSCFLQILPPRHVLRFARNHRPITSVARFAAEPTNYLQAFNCWTFRFGYPGEDGFWPDICYKDKQQLIILSPPRSRTLKENRNIAFYIMVFVSGWVRRSTGICLLPQIQILLHEKRAKITQTASFFPGLPCVRGCHVSEY